MITINQYLLATSLEEAYTTLMAHKKNTIIGGMLWLKMGTKNIHTAIDLSGLGLNQIEETEAYITIGCMTSLRQIETSTLLKQHFNGVLSECVKPIVGTQFRNCATLGGSVYGRFGFSDVLTALLALDSYVELYKGGIMPLETFINSKREKDILIKVMIRKNNQRASYQTLRNSATDFPVLAVCVGASEEGMRIAVGARPHKAKLAHEASTLLKQNKDAIEEACEKVVETLDFGSNLRASKDYREYLAKVLVERAIREVMA